MTPEQQAEWKDACNAMRDGQRIQVQLLSGEWADTAIFDPRLPHRRKPKPDAFAALKAAHAAGVRIEARQYPTESHAWHHVAHPNWSLDFEWRAVLWTPPPPPAGQQWHRTDWTQDMLPDGWRPLLLGEIPQFGDEVWKFGEGPWGTFVTSEPRNSSHNHTRTRRPLPTPPRMVPLGFYDVPPGSCLSTTSGEGSWWQVLWCGSYVIAAELGRIEYDEMQTKGFQIHRPGDNDADGKPVFRRCEKEETK